MEDFVLLLHDPTTDNPFHSMSPDEIQTVIARYGAWAEKMAAAGRLKLGHKLEDNTARMLTRSGVTDGPYPEAKEVIGGFFILSAESFDEAVQLSQDCPHLDFGRIEIRKVDNV